MARARVFDVDDAVRTAASLFWEKGYDRTSTADLTTAIGITPPSLYLAFGSKERLFRLALEHYHSGPMAFVEEALKAPTAREVAERLLHGLADLHTDPSHAPGCLGVNSALPCPAEADSVRRMLFEARGAKRLRLNGRFKRAQRTGDLPKDVDTDALTRFVQVIGYGMAVEAQSGAQRAQLHRMVDIAMRAWPRAGKRCKPSNKARPRSSSLRKNVPRIWD